MPLLFGSTGLLAAVLHTFAAQPTISKLERFSADQVLIHFDTDANRTYYLQYSSSCDFTDVVNLYTAFNYPFPDHYVIVDTRTAHARYYRLFVTTP